MKRSQDMERRLEFAKDYRDARLKQITAHRNSPAVRSWKEARSHCDTLDALEIALSISPKHDPRPDQPLPDEHLHIPFHLTNFAYANLRRTVSSSGVDFRYWRRVKQEAKSRGETPETVLMSELLGAATEFYGQLAPDPEYRVEESRISSIGAVWERLAHLAGEDSTPRTLEAWMAPHQSRTAPLFCLVESILGFPREAGRRIEEMLYAEHLPTKNVIRGAAGDLVELDVADPLSAEQIDSMLTAYDLEVAMGILPERQRLTLQYRLMEKTYEEIAALLGITVHGVKMNLTQARAKIRPFDPRS